MKATYWLTTLAVVVLVGLSTPSHAQFGRRKQREGGNGQMALLKQEGPMLGTQPLAAIRNSAVQEELKMTSEQKDRVEEVVSDLKAAIQDKIRNAKRNPFNANKAALKADALKMVQEAGRQAEAVLDDKQRKRFQEVCVNIAGSLAVLNPDIKPKLSLTSAQAKQIEDIAKTLKEEAKNDAASDAVKNAQRSIDALLTDSQRKTLKDLGGAPFSLPKS